MQLFKEMAMDRLTMQSAVYLLGLDVDSSRRTANIPCPICGKGREKKLNINFEKDVFRCNKCELSGGPLTFWAVYRSLPMPVTKEDARVVSKDYFSYVRDERKSDSPNILPAFKRIDQDIARIDVRNRTYRGLLSLLSLSEPHKENLLKRGLSTDAIEQNEYRSYPRAGLSDIASLLLESGYILDGVPGFYKLKSGKWSMRRLPGGFLIPQRDGFGRIQGFQLRTDKPTDDIPKYLTLSTAEMQEGAKGGTYPHLAKGKMGITELIITEGPLKGDIIAELTGSSVLALTGVSALDKVPSVLCDLKNAGMKRVLTAYDMDLKKNVNVQKALSSLKNILEGLDIPYQSLEWDDNYKGLDDFLVARNKRG